MDVVVYLALAVLCAVFIISLVLLIVMCRRRYEYNRLLTAHSLRFSKLKRENMDDIVQLSPHLSQTLSNNEWVFDVSGVLEHSVSVLKLCHTLTDKLAKIPTDNIAPQLNELICEATTRVVPLFDDVLRTLASRNVDVRLIEARVTSLTTAAWALLAPFYLLDLKYKEVFGPMMREMEGHQQFLASTVHRAQEGPSTSIDQISAPLPETSFSSTIENRKPLGLSKTLINETLLSRSPDQHQIPRVSDETTPPADPSTS